MFVETGTTPPTLQQQPAAPATKAKAIKAVDDAAGAGMSKTERDALILGGVVVLLMFATGAIGGRRMRRA